MLKNRKIILICFKKTMNKIPRFFPEVHGIICQKRFAVILVCNWKQCSDHLFYNGRFCEDRPTTEKRQIPFQNRCSVTKGDWMDRSAASKDKGRYQVDSCCRKGVAVVRFLATSLCPTGPANRCQNWVE